MSQTISDVFVEYLVQAGVQRIYGIVGDSLNPVVDRASIEYDDPYAVGLTGLIGGKAAYHAMHACDLLLLLGTDFPYEAFLPRSARIAQVDIRAENLGRRSRLDLGLWGEIRETINALLPLVRPKQDEAFLQQALHEAEEMRQKFDVNQGHQRRPIHPEYVAATLSELASDIASAWKNHQWAK